MGRELEQRPELRRVEEAPAGVPVDDRSPETELAHRPLQLRTGRLRVRGGKGGEAGEAVRVAKDRLSEHLVRPAHERDGPFRLQLLPTGGGERDDLQVDAPRVHVLDPPLAEVEEPLRWIARSSDTVRLQQLPGGKVLLHRDDPHRPISSAARRAALRMPS